MNIVDKQTFALSNVFKFLVLNQGERIWIRQTREEM